MICGEIVKESKANAKKFVLGTISVLMPLAVQLSYVRWQVIILE